MPQHPCMVANVVSLAAERAKRVLNRVAGPPNHPALRWLGADGLAHRRGDNDMAVCGATALVGGTGGVALPGTLRCAVCDQ
jgi:hypothetical protein